MSIHKFFYPFTFCCALMMIAGCQQTLLPEQVAEKFWKAVKAKDADQIQQYSTVFWQTEMDELERLPEFESFELGTITINDNTAEIETKLSTSDADNTIEFQTYLTRADKLWKVNFNKTINAIEATEAADVIAELSELGELLSDEINQSIDELNEALPKIEEELSEFEEKLQKEIPVIKQKIDALLKNLEELLSIPEEQEEAGSEAETTEI